MNVHRTNHGAIHTFSTITDILSFLPGQHGHTVCFKVQLESSGIDRVAGHSAKNGGFRSEIPSEDYSVKYPRRTLPIGPIDPVPFGARTMMAWIIVPFGA